MNSLKRYFKRDKFWNVTFPVLLVAFVVVFHAILLFPEVASFSPDLNDNVFHYALSVSLNEEIDTGGNPIDHWVPYWSMGFPVFHHYQHLPHLFVVFLYRIFYQLISMFFIYHLIAYLLLVFYPLVLYYSLRKLGLPRLPSAFASLFSLALSNINGYGLELGSFTWRGSGMLTQLWAIFLLPLTLSSIYNTLEKNKNYFMSVILLFLLSLSQTMFGVTAAITCLLMIFIDHSLPEIWGRGKRFFLIMFFFLLMIAYFFIPMLVDGPSHAHSTYDFPEKWNSYGIQYIVTQFLNGNILDYGRLAIVTFLTVIGLIFSLSRRSFKYRFVGLGFILWFLLYFGRPTWGPLFDLIPLGDAMHLHRFIAMVHFFSAILAGIGLYVIFEAVRKRFNPALALVLILLITAPVFWDRYLYLQQNNGWIYENKAAYEKEKNDLDQMLNYIKGSPPGRVYPGRRANWGGDFKIGQTAVFYFLGQEKIPSLSFLPFSWALAGDFSENFNEWRSSHYNLFNIRYILAPEGRSFPDFAKERYKAGRFKLYETPTTGYFDLVDSPLAFYGDKNSIWNLFILWTRSPMVDSKQHISVFFDRNFHYGYQNYFYLNDRWKYLPLDPLKIESGNIKAVSGASPIDIFKINEYLQTIYLTMSPGKIISENPGKNVSSCNIEAARDCFLLFKMTYHPCWHAYVDGRKVDKVILSPGFIGVRVNKGIHEVKFAYRPEWWKTPLIFVTFITAIALFVWEKKRK
ncbi:MAG: YfhO family protein [Candidatus Saganbacteria bacterium]|nr:YfhO family protein [Candidatus Saganbacteria bacterium]